MTIEAEVQELQAEAEMASEQHGEIGAILIWKLSAFVYPNKLGRVLNAQTGFRLSNDQPARMPAAAFVKAERLPNRIDEDIPFAPDLAVEVISRGDDWSEITHKARNYLQAGTSLVWVVDPYEQNVFVFRDGHRLEICTTENELDGGEVLPGFKLKISELFI